jgi:hypothetical protein
VCNLFDELRFDGSKLWPSAVLERCLQMKVDAVADHV